MGADMKEKNATDSNTERENSFTKTMVITMDSGRIIKWMERALFISLLEKLPMMGTGYKINFMEQALFIMINLKALILQ